MKKDYIKPCLEVLYAEICENLLQSSYVDVGGKTDSFNARSCDDVWDELDED